MITSSVGRALVVISRTAEALAQYADLALSTGSVATNLRPSTSSFGKQRHAKKSPLKGSRKPQAQLRHLEPATHRRDGTKEPRSNQSLRTTGPQH